MKTVNQLLHLISVFFLHFGTSHNAALALQLQPTCSIRLKIHSKTQQLIVPKQEVAISSVVPSRQNYLINRSTGSLTMKETNGQDDTDNLMWSSDVVDSTDSSDLYQALKNRHIALKQNIGRRYVCRTQKGFLNIHETPGDPYDTTNIVGQLREGQVVTSTGSNLGAWIPHDAGGWSISWFGGFQWLEPLAD